MENTENDYNELEAYKVVQRLIDENVKEIEICYSNKELITKQITELSTEISLLEKSSQNDFEIFSPRSESKDYNGIIEEKKQMLSDFRIEMKKSEDRIILLNKRADDLLIVLNVLSGLKTKCDNKCNSNLKEQLLFCSEICELDPIRVKNELLSIVSRETF